MHQVLQSPLGRRVVWGAAAVVLVIGMVLGTHFESTKASGATGQAGAFNATTFAKQKWDDVVKKMTAKAIDVTVLAPVADKDMAAAGKKYGQDLGAGSYAIPVKATGTVASVDANFMVVTVAGMPTGDVVRVPLGAALNGSPIRDATGTIHYGDFTDQTDYQDVANALGLLAKANVIDKIHAASLKGKKIEVIGGFGTGGPAKAFLINPVKIATAS